jgi:TonB family protein
MWQLPYAILLMLQTGGAAAAPAAEYQSAQPPARPARPARRVSGRISARDYPREARERGAAGRSTVRFLVDLDGTVPACEVVESSGYATLDIAACRVIEARFRFTPAMDVQGRPVQDIHIQNVQWELPDGPLIFPGAAAGPVIDAATAEYLALRGARPPRMVDGTMHMPYPVDAYASRQSGTAEASLIVGPTGRVIECSIVRSSGHAALDAHTCRMAMATARFYPAQDEAGNSAIGEHVLTVPWRLRSGAHTSP